MRAERSAREDMPIWLDALKHAARHLRNRGRLQVERSPSLLLVLWMIMKPDAPSDRPNTNAQPPESPAARQAAYPSDLAALVLTRWHEATAARQIDFPPPATSALVDVLSICYKATLLRDVTAPAVTSRRPGPVAATINTAINVQPSWASPPKD